jgi:hypothetical protein
LVSTVLTLSEMLGVPALKEAEVFIDCEAFLQELPHLKAFGDLVGAQHSIVIEALDQSAFVGKAGELVVGLFRNTSTRYSWNSKGTSLTRLR